MVKKLSPVAPLLFLACAAWAQVVASSPVEGRVDAVELPDGMSVEAQPLDDSVAATRAPVECGGAFTLRNLPDGSYVFILRGPSGVAVDQVAATLGPARRPVVFDLRTTRQYKPGGLVNIRTLAHPPAKKALRMAQDAQRHSMAGEYEKAISALEKALAISPDFSDARTNLGAQYLMLRRFPEAVTELEASIAIAPSGPAYCDLSVAFSFLQRPAEAEKSARQALALDPSLSRSHLRLGSVLADEPQFRAEAIHELKIAAAENPVAYTILARLYLESGDQEAAEDARRRALARSRPRGNHR